MFDHWCSLLPPPRSITFIRIIVPTGNDELACLKAEPVLRVGGSPPLVSVSIVLMCLYDVLFYFSNIKEP